MGAAQHRPAPPIPVALGTVPKSPVFPEAPRSAAYTSPGNGKRSLLVGINYLGTPIQLRGCKNDVMMMRSFLELQGWPTDQHHMQVLVEGGTGPLPTRANIISAMKWLTSGVKAGDSLFFVYSGHGSQIADVDGDEADGLDETLLPVDFLENGQISDDLIHRLMVAPLPRGVRLTALIDCCHSGTFLDLPFVLSPSSPSCFPNVFRRGTQFARQGRRTKASAAKVLQFSACSDGQTSADVSNVRRAFGITDLAGGGAGGAFICAFVAELSLSGPAVSCQELLIGMQRRLRSFGFDQTPQISASHKFNPSKPLTLTPRKDPLQPLPELDPTPIPVPLMRQGGPTTENPSAIFLALLLASLAEHPPPEAGGTMHYFPHAPHALHFHRLQAYARPHSATSGSVLETASPDGTWGEDGYTTGPVSPSDADRTAQWGSNVDGGAEEFELGEEGDDWWEE